MLRLEEMSLDEVRFMRHALMFRFVSMPVNDKGKYECGMEINNLSCELNRRLNTTRFWYK